MGVSQCSFFNKCLYSFNDAHSEDPSMDPSFVAYLKTKCPPPPPSTNPIVPLDSATLIRLDNKYYEGLMEHRGLLTSYQTLLSSQSTRDTVLSNAYYGASWAVKFAEAMVHMGSIEVLTSSDGEIRKHCSFVN